MEVKRISSREEGRKMNNKAKRNTLEIRMRTRHEHDLDWSATLSSASIQGPKLNNGRIFVWCRISDHRFVVKLAVLTFKLGIRLLQRRSASETLVNGGRGAFTVTNGRMLASIFRGEHDLETKGCLHILHNDMARRHPNLRGTNGRAAENWRADRS